MPRDTKKFILPMGINGTSIGEIEAIIENGEPVVVYKGNRYKRDQSLKHHVYSVSVKGIGDIQKRVKGIEIVTKRMPRNGFGNNGNKILHNKFKVICPETYASEASRNFESDDIAQLYNLLVTHYLYLKPHEKDDATGQIVEIMAKNSSTSDIWGRIENAVSEDGFYTEDAILKMMRVIKYETLMIAFRSVTPSPAPQTPSDQTEDLLPPLQSGPEPQL